MKKECWDFDENINYKTITINDNKYKVLYKYDNYYYSALILNNIRNLINHICNYLINNYYKYSRKNKILIKCFLDIHNNYYLLSEMQLNTNFDGLNKPKQLFLSNKENIGTDGKLRASYRDIFLTLRKKI